MVYFVNDEVNKDWSVVVHLKPRDSYDMGGNEDDEACKNEPWLEQNLNSLFENGDNLSDERYKNLLNVAAAANSSQDKLIAATNSSRDKSAASNASQVKSIATANSSRVTLAAAANFCRHKLTTGANFSRDKLTAAANSSRDKSTASNSSRDKLAAVASSSRDKSATSNSSEPSSVASTISNHPSEPKRKRGRESNHYWTVDAIEEYEDRTCLHLLVKNVHNLSKGLRIVVNFDKQHAAIGEAAGLLAGVCGQLATDCVAFLISFDKWSDIPKSFFENQWKIFSLARFCFKLSDNLAKQFLLQSLGEKWREHRIKLWNEFYDPRLSKTEIINNTLEDIAPDQWALFVKYRLKPETQNLCKRNEEIWQKQIIPHTSGVKSIARRRVELEKIEAYSSQQAVESTVNSPLDALGVVLRREHPGGVRGLGMGAVPTVAFKNNTTKIN
ncbi:uncharacterized protein LOC130980982 [Arachis stenosperma]|uniref:uncharacterized protein LOC130980982 n=1 Tax=Arachis stenosperma TaxID=217475 RepID=UPI0025ABBEFD|nr:uncharacterized protein LOC130980982 [Arachis stenosperma]